jgi:hypothetical protein
MTSFADIRGRIADDLDRPDINTQIGDELRRAVRHYERQRWWFNEAQATTPTVANQPNYALPTDLLVLDDLEYTNAGGNRLLVNEITWGRYLETWRYNSSATTGTPQDWAYNSDQLWLGPTPNAIYTLTLGYIKTLSPASFSDGTDNAWTNYADDLISSRALRSLGSRLLDLPAQRLAIWAGLEREAYNALCAMSEQKLMTGSPRPWT